MELVKQKWINLVNITRALCWRSLITFWDGLKDYQIKTNDWNWCNALTITQTLLIPSALIELAGERYSENSNKHVVFVIDQAKSLKFQICKYNDLDIMNSKFVKDTSMPLEITYIPPFVVLFFRSVLIASIGYLKLFLVSLPLRHIRCLLYVNSSF